MKDEKKPNRDFFGYLPHAFTINFDGGKVTPVSEFDYVTESVNRYINQDGFMYPPIEKRVTRDIFQDGDWEEIPKSERPALFHPVPTSHELNLYSLKETENLRKGAGGFIMHLLAYLFGVRLQFYNWWFDGRIPINRTHNIHLKRETVGKFVSFCYHTWRTWPKDAQKLITNVLYMHSRAPSYEWEWERFMVEYMVLDGCWKTASKLNKLQAKTHHKERIRVLCQEFGIPLDEKLITDIVTLRNELFHETLWDKSQPCTAPNGPGLAASLYIRKLNQRLVPAILGYDTPYIRTPWWIMGTFSF